jgi:hypothetical protein
LSFNNLAKAMATPARILNGAVTALSGEDGTVRIPAPGKAVA